MRMSQSITLAAGLMPGNERLRYRNHAFWAHMLLEG
jgi:hypothetical protein